MIEEKIMQQLQEIAKQKKKDVIELVAELDGQPVFRLRKSSIPKGAKVGYPFLLSVRNGDVYELNHEQIHQVIVSYNGFCKRLQ